MCVLEVVDGVEFYRKQVGGVDGLKHFSLSNEALEGKFVEYVAKTFQANHLVELVSQSSGIVSLDNFDTD